MPYYSLGEKKLLPISTIILNKINKEKKILLLEEKIQEIRYENNKTRKIKRN